MNWRRITRFTLWEWAVLGAGAGVVLLIGVALVGYGLRGWL